MISAFVNIDGKRHHLGTEAVLSRWHVEGCANCQTHLRVRAAFRLHGLPAAPEKIEVEVKTRDGLLGGGAHTMALVAASAAPPFKIALR
jgi:tyrosinase